MVGASTFRWDAVAPPHHGGTTGYRSDLVSNTLPMAVMETAEAKQGDRLRAQSQDNTKRPAQHCREAVQKTIKLTTQRRSLRRVDCCGVNSTASTTLRPQRHLCQRDRPQRDHRAGTVPQKRGKPASGGGHRNPAEAADP